MKFRNHGTYARYTSGCRCDECRAANARYIQEYRRRPGIPYRLQHNAYRRALHRLRAQHEQEFAQLYAAEVRAAEREKAS